MARETDEDSVNSAATASERLAGQFGSMVRGSDAALRLDLCCLQIARIIEPRLDPLPALALLDRIARDAIDGGGDFAALRAAVYERHGFRGVETEGYYEPLNSCLHSVVQRREGIPITLAVVVLEAARRAGVEVEGIGSPRHFLVRHDGRLYDPFQACGEVARDHVVERLEETGLEVGDRADSLFAAVTKRQLMQRVLNNLGQTALQNGDPFPAAVACSFQLAIAPWSLPHLRDRGVLYMRAGLGRRGLADLVEYVKQAPDSPDRDDILRTLDAIRGEARRRGELP